MHEVNFFDFTKGIFRGLIAAVKTDVDVFLLTFSAIIWPIKILKGLSFSTLIYVIMRRADGLMTAYLNIKNREMSDASRS
jgi:hypothetical protein